MRRFCECLFERTHPRCQDKVRIPADEEMDVVGHNDVSTDGDVEILEGALGELLKCRVNAIRREPFLPIVSTECYEPNETVERLLNACQAWRPAGEAFHGV